MQVAGVKSSPLSGGTRVIGEIEAFLSAWVFAARAGTGMHRHGVCL